MTSINRIAWMWDEALQALEQADRRQRQFCRLAGMSAAQPLWEPPADVYESESEVLVTIALPGVAPEAVSVQVVRDGLVVSAERALPPELETMRVCRLEVPYGRFERHIALTRGQYALTERRVADGCVMLRLVKE